MDVYIDASPERAVSFLRLVRPCQQRLKPLCPRKKTNQFFEMQQELNALLRSIAAFTFFVGMHSSGISAQRHIGKLPPGEFFWEPELAPSGPLVMIISLPEQTLSAYRNGIRIAYSSISSGVKGAARRPVCSRF